MPARRPRRTNGFRDGLYLPVAKNRRKAILDLRLHRLTALEQGKLIDEYQEILDEIAELLAILASTGAPARRDSRRTEDDPRDSTATIAAPRSSAATSICRSKT